jgi:hypothetical protein
VSRSLRVVVVVVQCMYTYICSIYMKVQSRTEYEEEEEEEDNHHGASQRNDEHLSNTSHVIDIPTTGRKSSGRAVARSTLHPGKGTHSTKVTV